MTVSVCLPVYNGARYVRQAVASVLEQTYEDIELVVVDNASTDTTLEELRSFERDPRLRVLTSARTIPVGDN